MTVQYLTVDGVIALHEIALEYGGGLNGIRSTDAHPTIPEKAAAYGFFIAEGQPFVDGNKRTALLAMETFLSANGYELTEDNDVVAQLFEDLGQKVIDQSEFFGWVCNHARPQQ